MKKPKLRELKEAVTALWKGPYTIDFPRSPSPVAAEYRGKPEYQEHAAKYVLQMLSKVLQKKETGHFAGF